MIEYHVNSQHSVICTDQAFEEAIDEFLPGSVNSLQAALDRWKPTNTIEVQSVPHGLTELGYLLDLNRLTLCDGTEFQFAELAGRFTVFASREDAAGVWSYRVHGIATDGSLLVEAGFVRGVTDDPTFSLFAKRLVEEL